MPRRAHAAVRETLSFRDASADRICGRPAGQDQTRAAPHSARAPAPIAPANRPLAARAHEAYHEDHPYAGYGDYYGGYRGYYPSGSYYPYRGYYQRRHYYGYRHYRPGVSIYWGY